MHRSLGAICPFASACLRLLKYAWPVPRHLRIHRSHHTLLTSALFSCEYRQLSGPPKFRTLLAARTRYTKSLSDPHLKLPQYNRARVRHSTFTHKTFSFAMAYQLSPTVCPSSRASLSDRIVRYPFG
jgi:hypothetical protein